jgi:ComF family protein
MRPAIRRIAAATLDALCPERCAACGAVVAAHALFCHACRDAVNVLGPPECERCGCPLAAGFSCERCVLDDDAAIGRARAFARYETGVAGHPVARAVHAFKYAGTWRFATRFAAAMLPRVPATPWTRTGAAPLVVPVPLHHARLRVRGYNQSAMLALHIARARRWPVALALLVRTRDTPSQTALTAAARRANVADAFAVRRPSAARDRDVLLVDDVWTSGATARAAAHALRRDGARAVDVLTFARVADPRYESSA